MSVGWPNLFRVGKTKERQLSVDPATGSFSLSVAGSVAHLELTTKTAAVVHGEELSNGSTQSSSRPDRAQGETRVCMYDIKPSPISMVKLKTTKVRQK